MSPKAKKRAVAAPDRKTTADKAAPSPATSPAAASGGLYTESNLQQLAPLHQRGFVLIVIVAFTLLYGADLVGDAAESWFLWSRGEREAAPFITLALQSLALYVAVGVTAWLIATRLWPSAKKASS